MTIRSDAELERIWNSSQDLALAFADLQHFIDVSRRLDRTVARNYVEQATTLADTARARSEAAAARIHAARGREFDPTKSALVVERCGSRLIVWLYGSLGPYPAHANADAICAAITQNADASIIVRIASSGGYAEHGDRIAEALARHSGETSCIVDKFACSAATVVATACRNVRMRSDAVWMIHETSATAWGNATDLRHAAEALEAEDLKSEQHYTATRGIPAGILRALMREARYLTAEEARAIGFVDEIVPPLQIPWDAHPWP